MTKNRILMLSPSVEIGVERELSLNDLTILADLGKGSIHDYFQVLSGKSSKPH